MTSPKQINFRELIRRAAQPIVERAEIEESPAAAEAYSNEQEYLETEKRRIENADAAEKVHSLRQDRELRKKYADKAFFFLYLFSGFSAVVLVMQGANCIPVSKNSCQPFNLPEAVIVTLIGATAASVIGLVGWVAKGLFRAPADQDK